MTFYDRSSLSSYYSDVEWDEASWVEIIRIEYDSLMAAFDFNSLNKKNRYKPLRLLDLGCGTGIFPRILDSNLKGQIHFNTDLLDISRKSLEVCQRNLDPLDHFSVENLIHARIEDLGGKKVALAPGYDLVWALHSFTTVDIGKMKAVLASIMERLKSSGLLLIYQMSARSSYQLIHNYFRELLNADLPPYMTSEETTSIIKDYGWSFTDKTLKFSHEIPKSAKIALENYLQKVVLDDAIDATHIFAKLLEKFRRGKKYVFPQEVHLIIVEK